MSQGRAVFFQVYYIYGWDDYERQYVTHSTHIQYAMSLLHHVPGLLTRGERELACAVFRLDYQHFRMMFEYRMLLLRLLFLKLVQHKKKRRAPRKYWVRPYLQKRVQFGHYHNLMRELSLENPELYRNFMRLDEPLFNEVIEKVRPYLEKQHTRFRAPLEVGLRVAITLRFMATGESYKSLGYAFRVGDNTISKIVPETCRAIIACYADEVVKLPTTPQEWKAVANLFEEKWNFPHTIGAIDGKHIRIKNPPLCGSLYFNYKKFYSIVLLGLVDADYKFMYLDVGAVGSESDAGIFSQTRLKNLLEHTQANLPPPEPLSTVPDGCPVGYFIVGDDAFALTNWMLKPYPNRGLSREDRIYNYRQCRARRVVENAFGILANR